MSGSLGLEDLSVCALCPSLFHFCPVNESEISSAVLLNGNENAYALTFLNGMTILIFSWEIWNESEQYGVTKGKEESY